MKVAADTRFPSLFGSTEATIKVNKRMAKLILLPSKLFSFFYLSVSCVKQL